jgi:hypothetical protein
MKLQLPGHMINKIQKKRGFVDRLELTFDMSHRQKKFCFGKRIIVKQ